MKPVDEGERRRDRVAHGVGQQRAGERRDAGDRQRLKRSNTPLSMSSRSCTPVTTEVVMTVCTRMPGMRNGR